MQIDWKYFGGLVDGEGCVGIYLYDEMRPRTTISQRNREFLERLKIFLLSEGINSYLPKGSSIQLVIHGWENTYKFAKKILPYVIIKAEEFKLLIKAYEINKFKIVMYPPELLRIIIRLHEMKTKGRRKDKSLNKAKLLLEVSKHAS